MRQFLMDRQCLPDMIGKQPGIRIKGQVEALERALEQEAECMATLQQIAAIRGATAGLMLEVLEGHLREHLGAEDAAPQQRSEELEQVIAVLRSYLK